MESDASPKAEMRLVELRDIALNDVKSRDYDLALYASGYETRAIFLPIQMGVLNAKRQTVLGFDDPEPTRSTRAANDHWWRSERSLEPARASADDPSTVYKILNVVVESALQRNKLNLFIDYSSMSRVWYAAVLNWIRESPVDEIDVDFAYAAGSYRSNGDRESDVPGRDMFAPLAVERIDCVPGFEGSPGRHGRSAAICTLGLDKWQPWSLIQNSEPDRTLALMGHLNQEIADIAWERNRSFVEENISDGDLLEVPLQSLSSTYRTMSEVASGLGNSWNVSIASMGPKPLALAALLVGWTMPTVSCLRLHGRRPLDEDVEASGETVLTRVRFKRLTVSEK